MLTRWWSRFFTLVFYENKYPKNIQKKNNRDINGIEIDREEYEISQYDDDTSLISDGPASSLAGILQTVDYFAEISGLKINFSKTKLIFIYKQYDQ